MFDKDSCLSMDGFTGTTYYDDFDDDDVPEIWTMYVAHGKLCYTNSHTSEEREFDLKDKDNALMLEMQTEPVVHVILNREEIFSFEIDTLCDTRDINIHGKFNKFYNNLFNEVEVWG